MLNSTLQLQQNETSFSAQCIPWRQSHPSVTFTVAEVKIKSHPTWHYDEITITTQESASFVAAIIPGLSALVQLGKTYIFWYEIVNHGHEDDVRFIVIECIEEVRTVSEKPGV